MKKAHIRILVVVMSVALLALLAVQWFWVQNAVALREKQFRYKVRSAMEAVVERLQEREISIALNSSNLIGLPVFHFPPREPICCPTPHKPRTLSEGLLKLTTDSMPTHFMQQEVSTGRMVNGKWVEQKSVQTTVSQGDTQVVVKHGLSDREGHEYINNVIHRLLQGGLPIHQRLEPSVVDSLLKEELLRREIEDPFVYNITQQGLLSSFLQPLEPSSAIDNEQEFFRVQLFPHDIRPSEHFLELQFPNRQGTTLRAMGLVLPTSGVLVVIVMGCFGIALIAFRRQQKLSDLKTDFINNMTHELKTPISTISLALEVLSDPQMQTKERIGLYTKVIGQENDRLKTQVDRVLQAAAMERGELKLDLLEVDLDQLIQEQIERIRLHVENRGGTIHYRSEATNMGIQADEVHLGGVIFNLLDNANKYSPEKPQISVRAYNVLGGIEIEVQDLGIGISSDSQRKVFDKFYRVPTGNVHDVKGFGIGLSYALSMAKAHGGDIRLRSEVGRGSTFTLFLPQKTAIA
ncbi:MAG: HAMP domain-containing histidine kinase [Bacteroidetes bacterium]|nr:HAMP domain-containing histidine kinase [Bacteroidota bacterium]